MERKEEAMNILCLSTDKWDGRWKRKQVIMKELGDYKEVDSIWYVNPPRYKNFFFKKYKYNDKVTILELSRFLWFFPKVYYFVLIFLFKIFNRKMAQTKENLVWLYGINASEVYVTNKLKEKKWKIIYDWTDDWSHITPRVDSQETYDNIFKISDLIFTVSNDLFSKAKVKNKNVVKVPNGTYPIHELQLNDDKPFWANSTKKVIGYVGQITDRLDVEIVENILKENDCILVLIGPIMEQKIKTILEDLKTEHGEKLILTGLVNHNTAVSYTKYFDVCVIPHVVNELTLSMDPIKLYDYLAWGKPVITTKVGGVDLYSDIIYIVEEKKEFCEVINKINELENEELIQKRIKVTNENDWKKRVENIFTHINKL
ncbi:glycosyltransferase [Neobacillus sp. C211]|uniref:glycosyltransferase n=1 Tax=unclassified Neobacillus TaxID=2675272 RepID=UPI00397A5AA7